MSAYVIVTWDDGTSDEHWFSKEDEGKLADWLYDNAEVSK